MKAIDSLIDFLQYKMLMTDVYQPAVILHLLERNGTSSRADLAKVLSGFDDQIQEYYDGILMRWPKITLTKHNIVTYERRTKTFNLNFDLQDPPKVKYAADICEEKIKNWILKKSKREVQTKIEASVRYRILKAARGKCELCGISSKIRAIDIDHIVPKNKADEKGFVTKDGVSMHMHDERNLQALCFSCNRAKRDQDDTDFRPSQQKLVRDRIPEVITASGKIAVVQQIYGAQLREQLFEKLTEEHSELLENPELDEIADMMEVLFSIARTLGHNEEQALLAVRDKRTRLGGFDKGIYLTNVQNR
jgi:predicted house-cleaning noncanonical NTP pyrophosphatase (MazG superfamily)